MKLCKVILLFLLSFPLPHTKAQGLLFASEDSLLTQRTSLHLFNKDAPVFHEHVFVKFDLSLWDKSNLGYVFDLTDKENSYSLSYLFTNGEGFLNLNIDSKSNKLRIPLATSLLQKRRWIKVSVDFDLRGDRVVVSVDGTSYRADGFGFKPDMAANFIFGKNQYYTEVPNMAIKNIELGDGRRNYSFPLDEWRGTAIHDSEGEITGFVENPVWLINESFFWKPLYTGSFSDVAGLNFNPTDQNLFIFTKDSLITYDPLSSKADGRAYANKMPVPMVLGKSIFNTRQNKCYVYELFDVPRGMPSIASLDMDTGHLSWKVVGRDALPSQLHHHNIFYDPRQDKFYLFGGYGLYRYHNTFLQYNDTTDKWQQAAFGGDTISPRFFSAIGPSDKEGELFLFGGYGNESGSQVVGGKQYYDFYRIDLATHRIRRCWTISPANRVFVPANNLVLSEDKRYFYALCYPHEMAKTELKLYRFLVKDGSYEVVSAPIPMRSMRIESDVNLFYSKQTGDFVCAVQEFEDRKRSVVKLYSLASPPVSETSYIQASRPPEPPATRRLIYILAPLLAAGILVVGFLVGKRAKERVGPAVATPGQDPIPEWTVGQVEVKRNAVYLLGEFAVFDKAGTDITHLFSPKIKQLFVLILLNSKEGSGISSKKISAKLWPDKDIVKTKNIKGVTFNHLRSIISDIDGIELVFQNDTYSFKMEDTFYCDYGVVLDCMAGGEGVGDLLDHFLLVSRGTFLRDMPEALLDHHRTSYEDRLTRVLLVELEKLYETRNLKMALEVAKLILCMDAFNEEALKYQLKSGRRLKGIEYSRKAYDQFTEDYKRSLGIAYHVSFDKIVG